MLKQEILFDLSCCRLLGKGESKTSWCKIFLLLVMGLLDSEMRSLLMLETESTAIMLCSLALIFVPLDFSGTFNKLKLFFIWGLESKFFLGVGIFSSVLLMLPWALYRSGDLLIDDLLSVIIILLLVDLNLISSVLTSSYDFSSVLKFWLKLFSFLLILKGLMFLMLYCLTTKG